MDFIEAIMSRCSIRKYTGETVTDEQMDMILKAGFAAPSAHNLRPWHFIQLRNDATLQHIADLHPYAKMLPDAGSGIVICGDKTISETEGFMVQDCSAAIQNMLIAINGLGLGGVWIGVYPVPELMKGLKEYFHIPDTVLPIGIIAVGHKAGSRYPFDKYDPERVHMDQW